MGTGLRSCRTLFPYYIRGFVPFYGLQKSSAGLWVTFLLPVAILVGGWKTESFLYKLSVIYSLNLLLNVFHLLYHILRNHSLYVTNKINTLCAIPSLITIYFYTSHLQLEFKPSLCYTVANALIYFEGLPFILKVFPNSFSFGEANLVIQGLSLFLHSIFIRLSKVIVSEIPHDEYNISTTILQLGILGMLLFCTVPFVCQSLRNPWNMYIWLSIIVFGFITNSVNYIVGQNAFHWLSTFFLRKERFFILTLWLMCSVMAGMIFWHRVKINKEADTVLRKYFHILAGAVYVTGIIFDTNLIYFASGCALAVIILIEVFRVMKIPPLYTFLQSSFKLYADEKDCGILALTPIYLLVGLSLPLWLHPLTAYSSENYIQLLSGVLSVGIGDTCASVVGKRFGKHRWRGSIKTIEGTIASICGQSCFVVTFILFGFVSPSFVETIKIFIAIVVSSIVEAFTDQIDNIILPLISYILLMI